MTPDKTADGGAKSSNPRVLVSLLSYNAAGDTIETIRHLQRQTYSPLHLLVVDNASPTNSAMEIARAFPDLHIRILPKNLGYTGGNNVVLKQALDEHYEYVVLCNHDIEVDEYAIERLVETAQAHADAGVIGGIEINLSAGERASGGGQYNAWLSRMRWLDKVSTEGSASVRVEFVHGALVLFTRRALESGVLLNEDLFMYFDEVDLGFRLKEAGLSAYVDQRVRFKHKSTTTQLNDYTGYLSQRNRVYMIAKHGVWYQRLFYHLYVALIELPLKVAARTMQGHPGFALACIQGHLDGMRGRMGRGRVEKFLGNEAH